MIGNLNVTRGRLSGTLSSGGQLSGKLSSGINHSIYYTKSEIDAMIRELSDELEGVVVHAITYLDFPLIGDPHSLYVDTTNNAVYRWDSEAIKYYCIGRDSEGITIINANFGAID